jgi:hypothetical protein
VGTPVTIKWDAPGQTLTLGLRSGPSCLRRGEDCERQGERMSSFRRRTVAEPEDNSGKFGRFGVMTQRMIRIKTYQDNEETTR